MKTSNSRFLSKVRSWLSTQSIADEIDRCGGDKGLFGKFYLEQGDLQFQFVEKLIWEAVQNDEFEGLSSVQKATVGLEALRVFQRKLLEEMYQSEAENEE